MNEIALLLLRIAAKEGIPVAVDFVSRVLGTLPKGDPTRREWESLRKTIARPFNEVAHVKTSDKGTARPSAELKKGKK